MTYITYYEGEIKLNKKLTPRLAQGLRDLEMQFVPSEDLSCIVDDPSCDQGDNWGSGFVDFLAFWHNELEPRGYKLNGYMIYHGEDFGDCGQLFFRGSKVFRKSVYGLVPSSKDKREMMTINEVFDREVECEL